VKYRLATFSACTFAKPLCAFDVEFGFFSSELFKELYLLNINMQPEEIELPGY